MNALTRLWQWMQGTQKTQELPPDPQQLLHLCQTYAAQDANFRGALFDIWAQSTPAGDDHAAKSFANTLGDPLLVNALRARADVGDSIVYAHHVFAEIELLARRHRQLPIDAILEIGPGTNLGALFCFVVAGVQYAAGVDVQELPAISPSFYATLKDYLACVEGFTWWRSFVTQTFPHVTFPTTIAQQTPEALLQQIDHRRPVASTPYPFAADAFDLIYSVSALEHIPDPERVIHETHRLLRPGALNIHEIGLQHHGSADPLHFLTWSEEEYNARAQPYGNEVSLRAILDNTWRGEIFCNRLRQSDWVQLFENAGFALLEVEPIVLFAPAAIQRERFVEPFRSKSLEDLSVLGVRLVARCDK